MDIAYMRTHEGWLLMPVMFDQFSWRVIGWSIGP